jgi:predicted secreted protein
MANNKIKGEGLILYIHDGSLYRPVSCLTSNSLNTELAVIESQTKCSPGLVEKQAGAFSYTIDADAQLIDTTSVGGDDTKASHDYLLEVQQAKENVNWKMDSGTTGLTYYGNGLITSLGLEAPAGDDFASFSLTIDGSGAITTTDPLAPSV